MVGSLSGAMEEVYVAKETIRKWNQQNAARTEKVFIPVEWGYTTIAVQMTDLVVGIIDNWLENPHFVESCIAEGKRIILLFKQFLDPMSTINFEFKKVEEFREKVKERCLCLDYNGISDFEEVVRSILNAENKED